MSIRTRMTVVPTGRRLVVPGLVLTTAGLTALVTTWPVAALTASVPALIYVIVRALRRATRKVDRILREELGSQPVSATEGDGDHGQTLTTSGTAA